MSEGEGISAVAVLTKPATVSRLPAARDGVLIVCFLFALFLTPCATIFAPRLFNPQSPTGVARAIAVSKPDKDDELKLDDFVARPGALQTSGERWAWRIGGALYQWSQFFQKFKEQFAFREPLLRGHAILKRSGLATTRSPQALLGEKNWIFLSKEDEIRQFCRTRPFSANGLKRWSRFLEREQHRLAERGITLLIVVAPEKRTIYPEYMPAYLRPRNAPSRLDQLMASANATGLNILDLRPALLAARKRWPGHDVYFRTDTHWNSLGAYAAYEATMRHLKKRFPAALSVPESVYQLRFQKGEGGDLTRLLGWRDSVGEEYIEFAPRPPRVFPTQNSRFVQQADGQFVQKIETAAPHAPIGRVVIFGDSFVCNTGYLSFLSQHFGRTTVWRNVEKPRLDHAAIESLRPQVVIWEFVERTLDSFTPPA